MRAITGWLLTSLVFVVGGAVVSADDAQPANKVSGLTIGLPLPNWEGTDDSGKPWKSVDRIGRNIVVLYFYPGDFTGDCIKQAEAYREGLAKLEELGVELVGVS